ncbi:MAG: D-alanyl-D-alanine carboxypeptidase family protein [Roseimicrobium sp.]
MSYLQMVSGLFPRNVLSVGVAFALSWASFGSLRADVSVIAVDVYNKKIHVEQDANEKRPIGGLAKVATALVALDWSEVTKVSLGTLTTVESGAAQWGGGIGLAPGDQVSLRDLIYASMMTSDDDAATTLAAFVGNDINVRRDRRGNPIETFVDEMNKLAAREGMKRTHFANPHGSDAGRSISTAADLARLSMYAISRAPFRFYTNQRSRSISVIRGGVPLSVTLQNTNSLLGTGTIDGMKTGNTAQSGGCIIVTEERPGTVMKDINGQDAVFRHRMVAIILGSGDPFTEGQGLLQQGWSAYEQWLASGRPIKSPKHLLATF